MSKSVDNNLNNNKGETPGSSNQKCEKFQQKFNGSPTVALEVSSNVERLDYWKNLVAKLMKRIPLVPSENPF